MKKRRKSPGNRGFHFSFANKTPTDLFECLFLKLSPDDKIWTGSLVDFVDLKRLDEIMEML